MAGSTLRVNVRATALGIESVVTNDFTVAFEKARSAVTPVVPHSIEEAWVYINGYRQHLGEQVWSFVILEDTVDLRYK